MTSSHLLAHADAEEFLRALCDIEPAGIDLCYVDPPFNVGSAFCARKQKGEYRGKARWSSGELAYDDRWGGIEGFLRFLEPRLGAIWKVIARGGMVWIHLDHRAVHETKSLCDSLFGKDAWLGEVIWVPGNGARGRGFSVTHQTLLIFGKRDRHRPFVWNDDHPTLREAFARTSLEMHFRAVDENGRRYRERVIAGKRYRYYADEGRKLGSVWTDIPAMVANTPIHRQGTGYPTQKPERLLERIIRWVTIPGALVCDPMCGSGTTLVVAARLGRRFVGSDKSPIAIEMTANRLRSEGIEFESWRNHQATTL
ncbi:MAG TPA: site-specific DNA-methyltransferase [Polyangiaceae bacterium]|jgi:site-specific DNA-methyltransferase (adenine-specific)|nr:MAG: Modification methylase DpnIIB [Deltaproteobacteria bacterium ADurb.Bin207]HNS99535.1 site-specific DNA-methyltransferase [Polyangiaceae bacterium]HNZ24200.1 site-specific DNA-methyltransferase [Polyangiaceae bacterium]HOD22557.1 site-specific DNA-methyltransferase [Polyangiaceae bacterium]HOE49447.1 site-specific DNA-methyltransferase [Polyangiaceae bacterium]